MADLVTAVTAAVAAATAAAVEAMEVVETATAETASDSTADGSYTQLYSCRRHGRGRGSAPPTRVVGLASFATCLYCFAYT